MLRTVVILAFLLGQPFLSQASSDGAVSDSATANQHTTVRTLCRDLDSSGVIDIVDVMLISAHLGTTNPIYDIDGDGNVTTADLSMLANCWHQPIAATPRVNVPVFTTPTGFEQYTIFWFGHVTSSDNYADVRLGVLPDRLTVHVAMTDRYLWYDTSPSPDDLANWDAVGLYIDLDGNMGSTPDADAYRFVGQLKWWEQGTAWQAAFRGNGTSWVASPVSFTAEASWRGNAPNDAYDDVGWTVTFRIPFASLGLSGPPPLGTVWGLAAVVHDRDTDAGPPLADKVWPTGMDSNRPASWGQLSFGLPSYTPPPSTPGDVVTIRQGLNGAEVPDAAVGGHTVCGDGLNWETWGQANYAGSTQFNVQNQYDIADWWCFSKYYVTFPLEAIPPDRTVISATLTLHQFGGSGVNPQPSLIQVFTVADDWEETTINWNNAPQALENVSRTWVQPAWPGTWPGVPRVFDISAAVADAYAADIPLRLAVYSADTEYHSGKYFSTSDTGDWNTVGRPTLTVRWGTP